MLDDVTEKLEGIAKAHPDENTKKDTDFGIQKINDSISAVGQAVFAFNHYWAIGSAAERKRQRQAVLKATDNNKKSQVA